MIKQKITAFFELILLCHCLFIAGIWQIFFNNKRVDYSIQTKNFKKEAKPSINIKTAVDYLERCNKNVSSK